MPKFYVSSGSLQMVISKGDLLDAAIYGFLQTNKNDLLDEYFLVVDRLSSRLALELVVFRPEVEVNDGLWSVCAPITHRVVSRSNFDGFFDSH